MMKYFKNMEKIKIFLVIIITLIILSGCSDKITSGEIIDKKYTPAYTQTIIVPVTVYTGKSTTVIPVPYTYHYNDTWTVTIRNWNDELKKYDTATYRIDKDTFDSITIGGQFEYVEDMEPNIPEYTRERQE